MDPIQERLLQELEKVEAVKSLEIANALNVDHQKVVGAIKSLQSLEGLVEVKQEQQSKTLLSGEGQQMVTEGSHEYVVYTAVPEDQSITQAELLSKVQGQRGKIGLSKALASGWLQVEKSASGESSVRRKKAGVTDTVRKLLELVAAMSIKEVPDRELKELRKRNLVEEVKTTEFTITRGPKFRSTGVQKDETELTAELLQGGAWKNRTFKQYNFDALGSPIPCGYLHPLLKVRTEVRQVLLEMGFTEMPTNRFVESAFWNFDALFQPQAHPARDAQDTFFISDPEHAVQLPDKPDCESEADRSYLERVSHVHSIGNYGSRGYGCDWNIAEARKNLLRTHTTAVSARMLYELAQKRPFSPAKYFSIDRVFRNEKLDATHLAEFHQVEGVIVDRNVTLGDLMGVIAHFFAKFGLHDIQFKPTYNPYTEPSMEIFAYHPALGRRVEVGNSGVFRPEMLRAMNFDEDVTAIAWGLSLERPTMIKYGIKNIRDLIGPKVDLQMVYTTPICRLDK